MRVFAVTHRVPFPPNKGEKIRSFHLLKRLAERVEVHLFATADPPSDTDYRGQLTDSFASVSLHPIRLGLRKAASVLWLPSPVPLTMPAFFSGALCRSLRREAVLHPPDVLLLVSASSATYAGAVPAAPAVMDFVDVDSEKWRSYARKAKAPSSIVYGREAWTLRRAERRIARRCALSIVATETERRSLEIAPEARVEVVRNGVDTDFFGPPSAAIPQHPRGVVFFGAMDYPPNADAACFFHDRVLPQLRRRDPSFRFVIVGSNPTAKVQSLAESPGVVVTGFVDDIRPHVHGADVCVVPLRVARGVQNKVLEAMAMGVPVVASSSASRGIEGRVGDELIVADSPAEIVTAVEGLLDSEPERLAQATRGRSFVETRYGWQPQADKLYDLLAEITR